MKHIFLTGEKNIGKSKIIKTFISNVKNSYKIGGFLTYWDNNKLYLTDMCGTKSIIACEKSENKNLNIDYDAFNIFAVKLINESLFCDITIIDEIGFMESTCENFIECITDRFSKPVPILGVLRKCNDIPLIDNIKKHPNVIVVDINTENRDKVLKFLLEHFKIC